MAPMMGLIVALLLLLAGTGATPLWAQTPANDNAPGAQADATAGLLIVDSEGATTEYCVPVSENATGWDLLLEAGVAVNSEPTAMGAAICSINGTGCSSPRQSCFCQCQGAPCLYWSLWTQDAGDWVYANQGASSAKVDPGAVQAWVWGDGGSSKAPKPPLISYANICRLEDAVTTATPEVGTGTGAQGIAVAATPVVVAESGVGVAAAEANPAEETGRAFPWTSLLVLLPLPIILLTLLFRQRGK